MFAVCLQRVLPREVWSPAPAEFSRFVHRYSLRIAEITRDNSGLFVVFASPMDAEFFERLVERKAWEV